MSKLLNAIFMALLFFTPARAADDESVNLRLIIDADNALQTLEILTADKVTEAQKQEFLALPGTKGLIRKAVSWEQGADATLVWSMIERAKDGETGWVFYYDGILKNLDNNRALVETIEARKDSIAAFVNEKINPFLPAGFKPIDLEVVVILGGYSAGFTFGGENRQYIGVQHYKGDFEGVQNTIVHETFHNVQGELTPKIDMDACLTLPEQYFHYVLYRVFQEGSAEYVANMWDYQEPGPYIKEQRDHLAVNDSPYRIKQIAALIEDVAVGLYGDPNPENHPVWNIIFDYGWNNPGYFYGYTMTRDLIAAHGEEQMGYYLTSQPTKFFLDYITLKTTQGESPFRTEFVALTREIDAKLSACQSGS